MRYAPSPTGVLHFGNLRTAWISWAWARQLDCDWVVRFEDIDQPRVVAGAVEQQLADLRALGLTPDIVIHQSHNSSRHWSVFLELAGRGLIYPCFCSRKRVTQAIEGAASAPHGGVVLYDGSCRQAGTAVVSKVGSDTVVGWRFRGSDQSGHQDFVVGRACVGGDGLPVHADFTPSYNLACAIDDYDGEYPLLVRAWDLDHVMNQQRSLQKVWAAVEGRAFRAASVFHTSLVVGADGSRLEKRTKGVTLSELLSAGWTPARLVEWFERSFNAEYFATPLQEGLWGEAQRELRLDF